MGVVYNARPVHRAPRRSQDHQLQYLLERLEIRGSAAKVNCDAVLDDVLNSKRQPTKFQLAMMKAASLTHGGAGVAR
jgi:hypothetical protein